jgi:hypothetical protein
MKLPELARLGNRCRTSKRKTRNRSAAGWYFSRKDCQSEMRNQESAKGFFFSVIEGELAACFAFSSM